jgi:hypothetical protein
MVRDLHGSDTEFNKDPYNYRGIEGATYDSYVGAMADKIKKQGGLKGSTVLVGLSKDPSQNRLLNGNHRVQAAFQADPHMLVKTTQIDANDPAKKSKQMQHLAKDADLTGKRTIRRVL